MITNTDQLLKTILFANQSLLIAKGLARSVLIVSLMRNYFQRQLQLKYFHFLTNVSQLVERHAVQQIFSLLLAKWINFLWIYQLNLLCCILTLSISFLIPSLTFSLSLSLFLYLSILIYLCVCVCVSPWLHLIWFLKI